MRLTRRVPMSTLVLWFQRELVQQLPVLAGVPRAKDEREPSSERLGLRTAASSGRPPTHPGDQVQTLSIHPVIHGLLPEKSAAKVLWRHRELWRPDCALNPRCLAGELQVNF